MASLGNVFVGFVVILFSAWIALTLFLPLGGTIMETAVDLESFDSPLIPDFFQGGVWFTFSVFLIGMVGIGVIWSFASMLDLLGIGRTR